jgi:hypothetical protein
MFALFTPTTFVRNISHSQNNSAGYDHINICLLLSNTTTSINIPITVCRYITYVKTTCFGRHAAIIRSIQS